MNLTQITETLSHSRLSLDEPVRDALRAGRTVRSRNRDGEYAVILTDNHDVLSSKTPTGWRLDGVADQRADWTIAVTDFTFRNVAESDPDLRFYAPVFDRGGVRVGTIAVNGSPYGETDSDQGRIRTQTVFFSALRAGDRFRESLSDRAGRAIVFEAIADADGDGRVEAKSVISGEARVFELGADYLAFKVLSVDDKRGRVAA